MPVPGEPPSYQNTNLLRDYPGISPVNFPLGERLAQPRTDIANWFRSVMNDPSRLSQLSQAGLETRGMSPFHYGGVSGPGFGLSQQGGGDILRKILAERGYM